MRGLAGNSPIPVTRYVVDSAFSFFPLYFKGCRDGAPGREFSPERFANSPPVVYFEFTRQSGIDDFSLR
jgi:hypothetical protein